MVNEYGKIPLLYRQLLVLLGVCTLYVNVCCILYRMNWIHNMRLLGLLVGKLPPSLRPSYFCVESCANNNKKTWSGLFSAYILLIYLFAELHNFIT